MRKLPLFFLLLLFSLHVASKESSDVYHFDSNFLHFRKSSNYSSPNLIYFSHKNGILPGEYLIDIFVNGDFLGREDIIFSGTNEYKAEPNFKMEKLSEWGVNVDDFPIRKHIYSVAELKSMMPGFRYDFDKNNQSLAMNIPQFWINKSEWSQTPPSSWDDGETALLSNYRISVINRKYKSSNKESQSFTSNSGLNIAGWRVRHSGYWNSDDRKWNDLNTFAQHDYSFGQGGQFIIGQASTDDRIFESFPFEGVSIFSDDGMLIPAMVNYSPVVRGVAYTPAEIIIRQNGTIIWQGDVPAGPFELSDVYPLFSGDMDVEIRESNGEVRHFTQTSSTLPILQHKGRLRYYTAIGRYRKVGNQKVDSSLFLQTSVAWGLGWDSTLYGGFLSSENYNSAMLGIGNYNPTLGSFSLDFSRSESDYSLWSKTQVEKGYQTRLMYARGFESLGSQFYLSGYWYGMPDYYTFNEYQQKIFNEDPAILYQQKAKIYSQFIQPISNIGQMNFSAQWNKYHNAKTGEQFRLSYSVPLKFISANFGVNYNKQPQYKSVDKSLHVGISIPLRTFTNYRDTSISSQYYNSNNTMSIQTGINGSLFDQNIYYSVMEGFNKGNNRTKSGTAYVNYKSSEGNIQTVASHQNGNRQLQFNVAGGIALHKRGLTLTQTLSLDSANALIDTNGIGNIKVKRGTSFYTDRNGFAVVPNLIPYQKNTIALDITKVNDSTEIIKSSTVVTPSRGALVIAKFNVLSGYKALININKMNGEAVPFGSVVSIMDKGVDNSSGLVSDNGQVWMSGLPSKGVLKVQWGNDNKSNCLAPFNFSGNQSNKMKLTLICK